MAAKISAARALARKLSEVKQAAVTAAKLAADQSMDEAELDRSALFLPPGCSRKVWEGKERFRDLQTPGLHPGLCVTFLGLLSSAQIG